MLNIVNYLLTSKSQFKYFKMKRFLVFTGLVVCIACSSKVSNNQSDNTLNGNRQEAGKELVEELSVNGHILLLKHISELEYNELSQKVKGVKISRIDSDLKQGGKLILPLANGTSKVLLDKKSDTEIDDVSYSFIGKIDSLSLYVIKASFYETSEFILMDKETGEEIRTWGKPIISPDFKHLFSYGDALGYDVMPNGIQMWKFEDGKLKIDWEIKPDEWKPQSIDWLDENTLLFIKVYPKEFTQKSKDIYEYVKLIIK